MTVAISLRHFSERVRLRLFNTKSEKSLEFCAEKSIECGKMNPENGDSRVQLL